MSSVLCLDMPFFLYGYRFSYLLRYHAAAAVAALENIGLIYVCIHLSIGLIHLHNQVVRVHREEILLSERGPVLLIRCEVILILCCESIFTSTCTCESVTGTQWLCRSCS